MQINVISTYDELLKFETVWKDIFKRSGTDNIFVSWEWCTLWWRHFGHGKKMFVLSVTHEGNIIAIAPLMAERGGCLVFGKPVISFLGDDMMADYMDFVILQDHKEVAKAIINYLLKQRNWAVIKLKRIPEISANFPGIKEAVTELAPFCSIRIDCVSPFIEIKEAWDDYYKSLSKGLKQDIRTTLNKLKNDGELVFENCDENTLAESLKVLFEIHKKRQIDKVGDSIFDTRINRDFFQELAVEFTKMGMADISVLKVGNKIISINYALKCNNIYYFWIPTFDPLFIKYSLGKLHILNILKKCFEQNLKVFDFMIGDEPYKFKWAKKTFNNYEIKVYNNQLFYKLDNLIFNAREKIVNLKNKYPLLQRIAQKM
ncbi:MAG: GNAT family N-acetyltransferase [bacterium]|nr:GNAT family N-acetyltransferase [bacterium]